jgi:hypothetical protein
MEEGRPEPAYNSFWGFAVWCRGTDAPTPQGVPWLESLPWSQDLPDLSDLFFLGSQHFATLVSGLFVLLALTCIHVHPIFLHPPGHLIVFATDPSGILKIT